MTALALVPLVLAAWFIAAVLWGGETLLQVRRQASWDDHCADVSDLFDDEPYEPPEFADPVLTVDDRQLLHGWGITP